jgi:hypothetical protein
MRGLRCGLVWLAGVTLAMSFTAARAEVPATLDLGGQVSGAASAPGGDVYLVFGVQGMRLQAQLTLPGHGALTLYDPEGAELSREEGEGSAELKYTLADDGIYLLGVTRAVAGADYVLALEGQVPRIEYVYDDPVAAPGAVEAAPLVAEPTPVPEVPAMPVFVPDPAVWGVYAQLAGRRTVPVTGIYSLAWQWVRPGEELVEQWLDGNDRVVHTSTFTPAGAPGKLHKKDDFLAGKGWEGTVEPDGSITFVGLGILMRAHQVGIADGVFEMRMVKKPGKPEMTVEPAGKRTRWVLEMGADSSP